MKKVFAALLAASLILGLCACGNTASSTGSATAQPSASAAPSAAASTAAPAGSDTELGPEDGFDSTVNYDALSGTTISIACSPVPHAEILTVVKDILAKKDITLDIQEYDDYIVPNQVVEDGTVYANFFQHQPYLDNYNAENGSHLVSVADIHVEPMGVYAGKTATYDALTDGSQIAVPNDPTNEGRALMLLAAEGLIEIDGAAGVNATVNDITSNPKNLKIVEMEAAQLPRTLQDVDMAVINGNYAVEAGLNPTTDAVGIEGSSSAYVNILVVKADNETSDETKALVAAMQSDAVRGFILSTYTDGSVIPVF